MLAHAISIDLSKVRLFFSKIVPNYFKRQKLYGIGILFHEIY